MAKIWVSKISDLRLNYLPNLDRADVKGEGGLDRRIIEEYRRLGFHLEPKTREEADALGKKNFNGLVTSIPKINVYTAGEETIVTGDVMTIRYLYGEAFKSLIKKGVITPEEAVEISPNRLNVSLIAVVKKEGKYYLLTQIKGKKTVGAGALQGALVAGGVNAEHLYANQPLIAALQQECREELGIDLSHMDSTSFLYLFDEREIGNVNAGAVARGIDLDKILTTYESRTEAKLSKDEIPEVKGLAKIQVAGWSLIPLENGKNGLEVLSYLPTQNGLVMETEVRELRPYAEALMELIKDKKNLYALLERAGF